MDANGRLAPRAGLDSFQTINTVNKLPHQPIKSEFEQAGSNNNNNNSTGNQFLNNNNNNNNTSAASALINNPNLINQQQQGAGFQRNKSILSSSGSSGNIVADSQIVDTFVKEEIVVSTTANETEFKQELIKNEPMELVSPI